MFIAQLKKCLKARGLSVRGRKKELLEQLLAAITSAAPVILNISANIAENLASNSFQAASYWKLIDPSDGEEFQEESQLIDGYPFRTYSS